MFQKLFEYYEFISWFVSDLKSCSKSFVKICAMSTLGTAGQYFCFFLVYKYIHVLQGSGKVSMRGVVLDLSQQHSFVSFAIIILILFVASSWMHYLGIAEAFKIGTKYNIYCEKRTILIVARQLHTAGPPITDSDARKLAKKSRYAGVSARLLAIGTPQVIPFFAGLLIMIYLDISLTVTAATCAAVGSYFYYKVSIEGADLRQKLEKLQKPSVEAWNFFVKQALFQYRDIDDNNKNINSSYNGGISYQHTYAVNNQQLALQKSNLISGIVISASLLCIFVLGVYKIYAHSISWGDLTMFLLSLRAAGTGFQAIMRMIVGINRFYPSLRDYSSFVRLHKHKVSPAPTAKAGNFILHAKDQAIRVNPDMCLVAISSDPLDRSLCVELRNAMKNSGNRHPCVGMIPCINSPIFHEGRFTTAKNIKFDQKKDALPNNESQLGIDQNSRPEFHILTSRLLEQHRLGSQVICLDRVDIDVMSKQDQERFFDIARKISVILIVFEMMPEERLKSRYDAAIFLERKKIHKISSPEDYPSNLSIWKSKLGTPSAEKYDDFDDI